MARFSTLLCVLLLLLVSINVFLHRAHPPVVKRMSVARRTAWVASYHNRWMHDEQVTQAAHLLLRCHRGGQSSEALGPWIVLCLFQPFWLNPEIQWRTHVLTDGQLTASSMLASIAAGFVVTALCWSVRKAVWKLVVWTIRALVYFAVACSVVLLFFSLVLLVGDDLAFWLWKISWPWWWLLAILVARFFLFDAGARWIRSFRTPALCHNLPPPRLPPRPPQPRYYRADFMFRPPDTGLAPPRLQRDAYEPFPQALVAAPPRAFLPAAPDPLPARSAVAAPLAAAAAASSLRTGLSFPFTCVFCIEEFDAGDINDLILYCDTGHFLCQECAAGRIIAGLDSEQMPIRCGYIDERQTVACTAQVHSRAVTRLAQKHGKLSADQVARYDSLCRLAAIPEAQRVHCPHPNCGLLLDRGEDDPADDGFRECPYCLRGLCVRCEPVRSGHPGRTCAEDQRQRERAAQLQQRHAVDNQASWAMLLRCSKACPHCPPNTTRLMHPRGHGCHHMNHEVQATGVIHQFCFVCGGPWPCQRQPRCPMYCDHTCACVPCTDCKPGQ